MKAVGGGMPKKLKAAKYAPGQIVVTKGGKRYIVDQKQRYVPLTSKRNAQRNHSGAKRQNTKPLSVSAPHAGSLQMINGQTFIVGEDRKTYIPITQAASTGRGVLTTLLEVAAVVVIADLVVDLIVDDIADLAQVGSLDSVGVFGSGSAGSVGFDGDGDEFWDMGGLF